MSITVKQLAKAAAHAHKQGRGWPQFWQRYGSEVNAAEPWDNAARRRIVRRLSFLVLCGDNRGTKGGDDADSPCPWELDDAEAPCVVGAHRKQSSNSN